MPRISVLAPAKINLHLHITGKREDGYHLLDSLVVFADQGDRLSVAPSEGLSLSMQGEFAEALRLLCPQQEDNLVYRTAKRLQQHFAVSEGAEIVLEKNLPIAAGIGGGSADAAAAARALCQLWNVVCSEAELAEILLPLGADIPMCLAGDSVLARGVGEYLFSSELFVGNLQILLVNPKVHISTPEVFGALESSSYSSPVEWPKSWQKAAPSPEEFCGFLKGRTRNDLEEAAQVICPEIGHVLSALLDQPKCLLARMSGSGATCFAIFESREALVRAQKSIQLDYPDWWTQPCIAFCE